MTVIAVTVADAGDSTLRWEIPPGAVLDHTPVPRGIRRYIGTAQIAALGAGDETNFNLTFTYPVQYNYLPKSLTIWFSSDDLTTEFSNFGSLEYRPTTSSSLGTRRNYALVCEGAAFRAAVRSEQYFSPRGTWKEWISGPDVDVIQIFLADISGDTSTAGDVSWFAEFWEYDIEQCLKWPVNTPQPTINY